MKHETDELILAAHVQTLAAKIRNSRIPQALSGEEREKWIEENPATKYVPDAMRRLNDVADMVIKIRTLGS